MENETGNPRPRVLSGMRPTGKLHLGNYVGALQNWVRLQHSHHCFFFVADWHALTTDYADTSQVGNNTLEVLLDWLGAGLDPQKCTLFVQSHVRQHAELHVLFSMITPLGWLERVPTYKDQQENLQGKDLLTYGFLGYPLLQAADILIYQADFVPVGEDQVAHVELTREVARRFNQFFPRRGPGSGPVIKEPQVLLTATPKLLGTDGRKMSKSYGNSILLSDEAAQVEEKIKNCVTDRPKLTDRGSPDRCPVGNLHQIFSGPERLTAITEGCTQATITCVECKRLGVLSANEHLGPIRERRRELARKPEKLREIIEQGTVEATKAAEETMVAVREAIGLLRLDAVEKLAPKEAGEPLLRAPETIAKAKDDEERWTLRTDGWLERVSKTYPLKKDRARTFITRRGRKVGIHTASKRDGIWRFRFSSRPINVLVLIAQDENRYLHDYVLPPKLVQEIWKNLKPNSDGQLELRLKETPAGPVIELSGNDVPIQGYKGDYSGLQ